MNSEVIRTLCSNSFKIINLLFGISFLILVGFQLVYETVPTAMLYYFFAVTGIFIGYRIAYEAIKYLNKDNNQNFRMN
ncbi:MAG: hypothetical protein RIA69_08720 [Cyclobacteriaceae bacterium]